MNPLFRSLLTVVAGALASAGSVHAATYNWTSGFADCAPNYASNNTAVSIAGAEAWSNATCTAPTVTNSSGQTVTSTLDVDVRGTAISGSNTYNGTVYSYGNWGLGVVNTNGESTATGPHSIDSQGSVDGIVLKFSEAVDLDSFTIGWNGTDNATTNNGTYYNDSDIQVYRWNQTTAPTAFNKTNSGWSLVGTYTDVGASNNTISTKVQNGSATIANSTATSSYWLISALGDNATDCNVDAFKLLSIAGNYVVPTPPTNVPEPGSIVLLGLGFASLMVTRRKSRSLR